MATLEGPLNGYAWTRGEMGVSRLHSGAFNSKTRSIGEVLGNNDTSRVVIPTFQRGYSWEKKHVDIFWRDIWKHYGKTSPGNVPLYFLGPVVTLEEGTNPGVIQILDGQQRLASATILLSVIRDLAKGQSNEGEALARDIQIQLIAKDDVFGERSGLSEYSLTMSELDRNYFIDTIQREKPITCEPTLKSHINIKKARKSLLESVQAQLIDPDPASRVRLLRSLTKLIRSQLVMACIPVMSRKDAYQIFETLNDRGLRLSVPDLLVSYLMDFAGTDSARDRTRDLWNDMMEEMGTRDIGKFLRHMWVSRFGDVKDDLFSEIKEHIEKKTLTAVDFALSCSEECKNYVRLLDANKDVIGVAASPVRALVRDLDVQSSLPLLLSCCSIFSEDQESAERNKQLNKVARLLLVFVMRYQVVANLNSAGLENLLFELAQKVRKEGVKNRLNIAGLIKGDLVAKSPTDAHVEENLLSLILEPGEARYVIGRITAYLQSPPKEVIPWEVNIEHVFPRKPGPDWGNTTSLKPLLWHIGNLTALGKRLNHNAANQSYPTKREYYLANTTLEITLLIARDYSKWGKDEILHRADRLRKPVMDIWSFDNTSRV